MKNPNIAWRRKKYRCFHAHQVEETGELLCGLGLCQLPVLHDCCIDCDEYRGKDRGFGDTVKRTAEKLGVKPCGGCQKRREALNKLTGKIYDKLGKQDNDS
jgi:hypothetical protein